MSKNQLKTLTSLLLLVAAENAHAQNAASSVSSNNATNLQQLLANSAASTARKISNKTNNANTSNNSSNNSSNNASNNASKYGSNSNNTNSNGNNSNINNANNATNNSNNSNTVNNATSNNNGSSNNNTNNNSNIVNNSNSNSNSNASSNNAGHGVGMTVAQPTNLARKVSVAVPPPDGISELQRNPGPQKPAVIHMGQRPERYEPRISDPDIAAYEEQVATSVRQQLKGDLERHCLDYCSILSIEVNAHEVFDTSRSDLGFESVTNPDGVSRKFRVKRVLAEILVDSRYGTENIEKLQHIFDRVSPRYGRPMFFTWSRISFPENAATQKSEAEVRAEFVTQVRHQVDRIISEFCPTECKLSAIDVEVARATMDEAERGSAQRFLFARDGRGALFVRGVQARLSINTAMDATRKNQITELVRESLLPFGSVSLEVNSVAFPKPASEIQKDLDDQRKDPFGIEKFGALMKLFRDNMVGKEVYKETTKETMDTRERAESKNKDTITNSSTNSTNERSEAKINNLSHEKEITDTKSLSEKNVTSEFLDKRTLGWIALGAGLLLFLVVGSLVYYVRSFMHSPQIKAVIAEGMGQKTLDPRAGGEKKDETNKPVEQDPEAGLIRQKLEYERLRDECLKLFVAEPKLAREAFTRILREDGAEATSKYVVIFGEIIVYELLNDLDLKESLNELAEYVHQNAPRVKNAEKVELLRQLRLKLTAAKVKLLANKTLDVFDFLKGWSPRQIFELAREEIPQMQGIMLTQLPADKRKAVFEMFSDHERTPLLEALSQIDIMPREVLIGAAEFIKEKATKNPRFDAENVRGTDVLIDLLTSSSPEQQVALMLQLDTSNPSAAWRIRSSLVSKETLLHLPDNMLVDFMFDLELREVASFLSGSKAQFRSSFFAKIPREIGANWAEAMAGESGDPDVAKAVETKILHKVRQLAAKGGINLAEINDRIYPRAQASEFGADTNTNSKMQPNTNPQANADNRPNLGYPASKPYNAA